MVGGDDRIDEMKQKVVQGDEFKIGSLNVLCLSTPCHTTGHICFYVQAWLHVRGLIHLDSFLRILLRIESFGAMMSIKVASIFT